MRSPKSFPQSKWDLPVLEKDLSEADYRAVVQDIINMACEDIVNLSLEADRPLREPPMCFVGTKNTKLFVFAAPATLTLPVETITSYMRELEIQRWQEFELFAELCLAKAIKEVAA